MNFRKVFLSLCLGLMGFIICEVGAIRVSAEQTFFPFVGEIIDDKVNVRAGQSVNFERLCQLLKGEEIVVVEEEYSWYKIRLPLKVKVYVHQKYIQMLGQSVGGILADRVNIRAGAGDSYTILGRLNKGEQVYIMGREEEWYQIEPREDVYGWIANNLVAFKSNDVKPYQTNFLQLAKKSSQEQESVVESNESFDQKETEVQSSVVKQEPLISSFKISGYVEIYPNNSSSDINHKVIVDGETLCYLKGSKYMFDEFVSFKVKIEGSSHPDLQKQYSYPVVTVSRIELIL